MRSIHCPQCTTLLKLFHYEGIEIDFCPNGHGVWLDKNELGVIINRREQIFSPEEIAAAETVERKVGGSIKATPHPCPVCNSSMKRSNYAYSSGIFIDRCGGCSGIWLDSGELEQIQIFVEQSENPTLAQKRAEHQSTAKTAIRRIEEEKKRVARETERWTFLRKLFLHHVNSPFHF